VSYIAGSYVRLSRKFQDYLGPYSGTTAVIVDKYADGIYNVRGYDNKVFICPESYFEEDELWGYGSYRKCECGADKVYGDDAPGFYHAQYCPKYSPPRRKEDEKN